MSSAICSHFTQNAWKKDLCSNCFKSKDEHKAAAAAATTAGNHSSLKHGKLGQQKSDNAKTDYPNKHKAPAKSIIKKAFNSVRGATSKTNVSPTTTSKGAHKVSFHKQLFEVIGYGGEWSDTGSDEEDDDHDFMNLGNEHDDMAVTETDDEETIELKRITRANTDFNMNNGNLLGDAQENIKKSFAALKLGAPQVDKEGKKQTLKINVVPFGAASAGNAPAAATTNVKAKFETKSDTISKQTSSNISSSSVATTNTTILAATTTKNVRKITTTITPTLTFGTGATVTSSTTAAKPIAMAQKSEPSACGGKDSPPIERAMEKSLLDEISETLEKKQNESKNLIIDKAASGAATTANATTPNSKIKFELTSLSESHESKPFLDLKKPIARNAPITKEHAKPKVNVCHKFSDTDSNCSDAENGVSAYYDVVETQISYENIPDGKYCNVTTTKSVNSNVPTNDSDKATLYASSQYITDMLLSSKTRAASYNLHEGNFMTSKITSDGLIVTKCSSDDALDSTGSSFDGSSDEETTYNMIRSESDSGIGISIGNEYKNVCGAGVGDKARLRVEKKLSASTNNSDYEDIQITEQAPPPLPLPNNKPTETNPLEKCRELHGEPDGSADPDNSLEVKGVKVLATTPQQLPALPKSPPPMKIDARPSFLHGLQKQQQPIMLKKPDLPAKPCVSPINTTPMKTFMANKRQPTSIEQQLISQLQSAIAKSNENLATESAKDDPSKLKKGRAPNPPPETLKSSAPPTPERDYNLIVEFETATQKQKEETKPSATMTMTMTMTTSTSTSTTTTAATTSQEQNTSKPAAGMTASATTDVSQQNKDAVIEKTSSKDLSNPVATVNAAPSSPEVPSAVSANASIYTRKPPISSTSTHTATTAAPVIREKDKRERAIINPKFRSLNTFVTQRSNAVKNLQLQSATSVLNLKQPLTPEPTPRHHKKLSMSEECLAANKVLSVSSSPTTSASSPTTPSSPPQKTKTKFSIKKFLRMGSNSGKGTDHLHKKDTVYTEICTGDDVGVSGKPRLVIIHPIDINPTAVEVVKDITKTNDAVAAQTVAVVTAKPPAPPLRTTEGLRAHDVNKPARPPPPKSAELRRKQKVALTTTLSNSSVESVTTDGRTTVNAKNSTAATGTATGGSIKCKADNVYANLGEVRSSIAPRKPERTASMREREAQLELARKRHGNAGSNNNNNNLNDTISICSSNGDNVSAEQQQQQQQAPQTTINTKDMFDGKPPTGGSRTSTFERKKNEPKMAISSKLEIFEQRTSNNTNNAENMRPSSLKDSVRKINNTIDNYLKDRRDYENMYEFVKTASSPPPPPVRSVDLSPVPNGQRLMLSNGRRSNLYSDTASLASYTRSEYGTARNYGLNGSLANIPRIISASYAGSEVGEFDIYAPYSYYGSEAGGDTTTDINDSVWGVPSGNKQRTKATNRLRMRKGRSVVHKSIEDNYTAVVVANHEALAQVLDQLQQSPVIPAALRPLANAINLRFEDFTILDGSQAFVVGKKAFHAALWSNAPVTLALSADCNQLAGVGGELNQLSGGVSGVLNPITEFCDLVPSYQLPLMPSTEVSLLQATISVLPRLQLDTLHSIGAILKGKSQVLDKSNFNFRGSIPNLCATNMKDTAGGINTLRNVVSVQNLSTLNEEANDKTAVNGEDITTCSTAMPAFDDVMTREVAFIMLQLVNGMKNLQAKAIEEMPLSVSNVVLSKDVENKDAQARLCVLQGNNSDEDEPMGTLCKCAYIALTDMLPTTKITPILADILQQERAESLSKAKSVLEFVLWGPSDVVLSGSTKERELALQRWLDLERATVLHGLVRTRVELTVYDECHLMFLVRSTAKMMNDAAKIVCSYQQPTQTEEVKP